MQQSDRKAVGSQTVTAVERAAELLQLFIDSDTADLGVTEIARRVGISKATVHRILTTLREKGFVSLDESSRRYRLGISSLRLGLTVLERLDVRELARSEMEELSSKTGETATLSIRTGQQRIYVQQITPPREVRMSVRIGHPWPLHAGSSGKAFLAFMPDADVDAYLSRGPLKQLTGATITDPDKLQEELAAIRRRRYATSSGERLSGAGSVATPLFDHAGQVVAVMSVCGPLERFRSIADQAIDTLLDAAGAVSKKLGYLP